MEFLPIFDIFHRLRPYLFSTRDVLWFYTQASHRRPGHEPFLLWGPPFMTGDGPNMAGLSTFQSGPKGFKRDQNGQQIWDPFGPMWTIVNKN